MCQAKGAKLANVEPGTDVHSSVIGHRWFELDKSEWSTDRVLLKKYLDRQRYLMDLMKSMDLMDLMKLVDLMRNEKFDFFWVGKGNMMHMSNSKRDGQIKKNLNYDLMGGCTPYGSTAWPVCQITR